MNPVADNTVLDREAEKEKSHDSSGSRIRCPPHLLYFLGCASDLSGFCAGIAACSLLGGTMFLIRM